VLIPALLAGGWISTLPADKDALSGLAAGKGYPELEAVLRPFTRLQDPPIDRVNEVWKIRAPVDAFVNLGHLIGADDLDRLKSIATAVFSRLDEPPNPNDLFEIKRREPGGHSEWLREGLATTLLQIATLHTQASLVVPGSSPQEYVDNLIRALPGLSSNYRLIESLAEELPLLAEAAPDPLLSALERLLEGDGEKIRPIFRESEHLLGPGSKHVGLLWALELLAWDPELLPRVSYLLARLAVIDPGGRLSNRPTDSLRKIFLSWLPQTNANVKQRITVLDLIMLRVPAVAWDLLAVLMPQDSDTSAFTQKPRFREAAASEREALTYAVVWESQREIVSRALNLAENNPERLILIIGFNARFRRALALACAGPRWVVSC
jgi:hypothetical protein